MLLRFLSTYFIAISMILAVSLNVFVDIASADAASKQLYTPNISTALQASNLAPPSDCSSGDITVGNAVQSIASRTVEIKFCLDNSSTLGDLWLKNNSTVAHLIELQRNRNDGSGYGEIFHTLVTWGPEYWFLIGDDIEITDNEPIYVQVSRFGDDGNDKFKMTSLFLKLANEILYVGDTPKPSLSREEAMDRYGLVIADSLGKIIPYYNKDLEKELGFITESLGILTELTQCYSSIEDPNDSSVRKLWECSRAIIDSGILGKELIAGRFTELAQNNTALDLFYGLGTYGERFWRISGMLAEASDPAQDFGIWIYIPNSNNAPIPTSTPIPNNPPNPSSADIEIVNINTPAQVDPGHSFIPEITVRLANGLQLVESRGDMLRHYSGTNYSAFPHIGVNGTVISGQTYTFRFYEGFPFIAPNHNGSFESIWRIWANGNWVGPEIVIRSTVSDSAGSGGHAHDPSHGQTSQSVPEWIKSINVYETDPGRQIQIDVELEPLDKRAAKIIISGQGYNKTHEVSGGQNSIHFTWDIQGLDVGDYTIRVEFDPSGDSWDNAYSYTTLYHVVYTSPESMTPEMPSWLDEENTEIDEVLARSQYRIRCRIAEDESYRAVRARVTGANGYDHHLEEQPSPERHLSVNWYTSHLEPGIYQIRCEKAQYGGNNWDDADSYINEIELVGPKLNVVACALGDVEGLKVGDGTNKCQIYTGDVTRTTDREGFETWTNTSSNHAFNIYSDDHYSGISYRIEPGESLSAQSINSIRALPYESYGEFLPEAPYECDENTVHLYHFDEGSGNDLIDACTGEETYFSTMVAGPANGYFGLGASINKHGLINIPNVTQCPFSLDFRFKRLTVKPMAIVDQSQGGPDKWFIGGDGDRPAYQVWNSTQYDLEAAYLPASTGDYEWHHMMITYDCGAQPVWSVYIDGELLEQIKMKEKWNMSPTHIRLGCRADEPCHTQMVYDEVRLSSIVRQPWNMGSVISNYVEPEPDGEWEYAGGTLHNITVGCDSTVWGKNHTNQNFYRWNGTQWDIIANGGGNALRVGTENSVWARSNYNAYHWDGNSWQLKATDSHGLSVGCDDSVWSMNKTSNTTRRWNGSSWDVVSNMAPTTSIHVGDASNVYGLFGYDVHKLDTTSGTWNPLGFEATWLTASGDMLWVQNFHNQDAVYELNNDTMELEFLFPATGHHYLDLGRPGEAWSHDGEPTYQAWRYTTPTSPPPTPYPSPPTEDTILIHGFENLTEWQLPGWVGDNSIDNVVAGNSNQTEGSQNAIIHFTHEAGDYRGMWEHVFAQSADWSQYDSVTVDTYLASGSTGVELGMLMLTGSNWQWQETARHQVPADAGSVSFDIADIVNRDDLKLIAFFVYPANGTPGQVELDNLRTTVSPNDPPSGDLFDSLDDLDGWGLPGWVGDNSIDDVVIGSLNYTQGSGNHVIRFTHEATDFRGMWEKVFPFQNWSGYSTMTVDTYRPLGSAVSHIKLLIRDQNWGWYEVGYQEISEGISVATFDISNAPNRDQTQSIAIFVYPGDTAPGEVEIDNIRLHEGTVNAARLVHNEQEIWRENPEPDVYNYSVPHNPYPDIYLDGYRHKGRINVQLYLPIMQ